MAEINEKIAQFIITNSTLFHSKSTHPENKLYFLADTEEIYRGDVPFTTSIIFYSGDLPEKPAERKLYINQDTFTGHTWSNDQWNTVIEHFNIVAEINANTKLTDIPNVEAIKKFIRSAISDMTYNKNDCSLNYTIGEIARKVVIDGIPTSADYSAVTNYLSFKNIKGEEAFKVKLPKDNFPVKGYYDELLKCIVLQMRSNDTTEEPYELKIPVGDLLDIKVSKVEGNALKKYDDGFGVVIDLSNKIDKVPTGKDGRILTAKVDGNANAINKFVGGAHFSLIELSDGRQQGDPNILATEAAVMSIIEDINDNIKALQSLKIVQSIDKNNPSENEYPSEKALMDLYNEANQILTNIKSDINTLNTKMAENSQGSEEIKVENDNIKQKLENLETYINGDVKTAVDKVPSIESDIDTNTTDINTLKSSVDGAVTKVTDLNTKFDTMQLDFTQLSNDCQKINDDLTAEMDTLTISFANLSSVQNSIETNFNNQIKELQDGLNTVTKSSNDHTSETSFRYFL